MSAPSYTITIDDRTNPKHNHTHTFTEKPNAQQLYNIFAKTNTIQQKATNVAFHIKDQKKQKNMSLTKQNNFLFIKGNEDRDIQGQWAKNYFEETSNCDVGTKEFGTIWKNNYFEIDLMGQQTDYAKGKWLYTDEEYDLVMEGIEATGEDNMWKGIYNKHVCCEFIKTRINQMKFEETKVCKVGICAATTGLPKLGTYFDDPQPRRVIDVMLMSQLLFRQSSGHTGVNVGYKKYEGIGGWEIIKADLGDLLENLVYKYEALSGKSEEEWDNDDDKHLAYWTLIRAKEWLVMLDNGRFYGNGIEAVNDAKGGGEWDNILGRVMKKFPNEREEFMGGMVLNVFLEQLTSWTKSLAVFVGDKQTGDVCKWCKRTMKESISKGVKGKGCMSSMYGALTEKWRAGLTNDDDWFKTISHNRSKGFPRFMGCEDIVSRGGVLDITYGVSETDGMPNALGNRRYDKGYNTLNDYIIDRVLEGHEKEFRNKEYYVVEGNSIEWCFFDLEEAEEQYYSQRATEKRLLSYKGNKYELLKTTIEEERKVLEEAKAEAIRMKEKRERDAIRHKEKVIADRVKQHFKWRVMEMTSWCKSVSIRERKAKKVEEALKAVREAEYKAKTKVEKKYLVADSSAWGCIRDTFEEAYEIEDKVSIHLIVCVGGEHKRTLRCMWEKEDEVEAPSVCGVCYLECYTNGRYNGTGADYGKVMEGVVCPTCRLE